MLEPSQYALGGLKFVPYKSKQFSKFRSSLSFVETEKALVQASLKRTQQSFIREKDKNRVGEKIAEPLRDESCTQVIVFEARDGRFLLSAVGGVEGRDGGINGKNNIKAKIPEGNNLRFPLKFNSNSKILILERCMILGSHVG